MYSILLYVAMAEGCVEPLQCRRLAHNICGRGRSGCWWDTDGEEVFRAVEGVMAGAKVVGAEGTCREVLLRLRARAAWVHPL